jgi:hypothetical protein
MWVADFLVRVIALARKKQSGASRWSDRRGDFAIFPGLWLA